MVKAACRGLACPAAAAWRGEVPEDNPRYYEASRADRLRYAGNYLLLLAFLCIMTYQVHTMLQDGAG